jgi:transposase InsO family protein
MAAEDRVASPRRAQVIIRDRSFGAPVAGRASSDRSARVARKKSTPTRAVARTGTVLPAGYASFLDGLKARIRAAQVKAALAVNAELVLLYWRIGRDILARQEREGWGARVIDRLSADLCAAFPEMRGFSPRNLKYMRAFAERFVRSIKQECIRHIVPLGEHHLRTVLREFVEHYHSERNHQGLGNVIPFPSAVTPPLGRICRRERLGGLLNFYERNAA